MNKRVMLGLVLLLPLVAGAAQPKESYGAIVDERGMTLYTLDKDAQAPKGACHGQCAANWPIAAADASDKSSGEWSVMSTMDGKYQWAYKGQRLYRFVKDMKPGDKSGDGVMGVWHVAKP